MKLTTVLIVEGYEKHHLKLIIMNVPSYLPQLLSYHTWCTPVQYGGGQPILLGGEVLYVRK